jgi:YD repeat-containing protein
LAATHATIGKVGAEALESEDTLRNGVCEGRAGDGDVDALTAELSWQKPRSPQRKPHSIWQHLLDNGTPDQVARLKDDPGLTQDAPVLTVSTAAEGTRGFSIGLEQLARHKAMWLPEHDVFITVADAPVEFAAHLASLKGHRVLDRIKAEPESTLAEWTNRWADFGNPTRPHHGNETEWLGTKGHLTGAIARHGSLYKFGVDRWANVRPDYASPHKFRLDLLWPGCQWTGQHILNGLPVISTALERGGQRCDIEQFAGSLSDAPPAARGEIPSVFFTRILLAAPGPVSLGFRLATQSTNRHPELRNVAGRTCVVDRETGAVWLMIEAGADLKIQARQPINDAKDPRIEFDCVGELSTGETGTVMLKLASPVVTAEGASVLAALDFSRSRTSVVHYWENWLAQGARFIVPEVTVNDLFRANLWHALLLPRHRTDELGVARIDLPYSNFAYGQLNADWPINQAVYVDYMIYGLRGHFAVAEEEFAAMYHTQQKPDGRVGGYAEWGVYSPSMLYSIAQNFLLSGDRASFERLLPASMKALDWCLGEVARGKKSSEAPGLIVAPLNDLTHDARAWGFPNAYFVAGLETSTTVNDLSNGGYIKGVKQTWVLRDVGGGADLNALNTVASLGYSIAPLLTQVVTEVGTGAPSGGVPGDNVGQSSTTNLTYDDLGDVIRQEDLGEDDDPNDDVVADYVYSRESNGSSGIGSAGDQPHDRPSPIWNAGLCPTWVSLPVEITVSNGKTGSDYVEYRHRDGRGNICDNASVTHLEETINGSGDVAETELTYDAWGSYDRIVYPVGQNGRRYSVQYVWDLDGHANIADVTEYDLDPSAVENFLGDGLVPGTDVYTEGLHSSALFDSLTNRVASRTDANGNVINYTYDALARLASVSSPVPSDPLPLVTFQYFVKPNDPHAVAHHYDAFHPADTIDTAAFADGIGRVVQTQNDATLFNGAGQAPTVGIIVSGATIFDALGRPVQQYNPTRGTTPLGTFDTNSPLRAPASPTRCTTSGIYRTRSPSRATG